MSLKNLAKKYFNFFSNKDIHNLSKMFAPNIILRDWQIYAIGKFNVIKANKKIFKNFKSIKVKPIKLHLINSTKTIFAEIEICVNSSKKKVLVLDILKFNNKNKINNIKAYLGSKS